jgi:PIN domain nuclease of toxin-antitoxin system
MKALLDTHTFLWWITDEDKLSPKVRDIIKNPENTIYFSTASAWEIVIKAKLKRIALTEPPGKLIPDEIYKNSFQILPIHLNHTLKVFELPYHHKDPFNRILAAQAKGENLPLLSKDKMMDDYKVEVIW